MKKLFEPHLLKGYAFGVAYENGTLQLAFIKIVLDINLSIIGSGLVRFRDCLREN